jgi:hypothetical protein
MFLENVLSSGLANLGLGSAGHRDPKTRIHPIACPGELVVVG